MLLIQVRDYIILNKEVTFEQLLSHFKVSQQVIEPILEIWLNKNIITTKSIGCCNGSKSCFGCNKLGMQIFIYNP